MVFKILKSIQINKYQILKLFIEIYKFVNFIHKVPVPYPGLLFNYK